MPAKEGTKTIDLVKLLAELEACFVTIVDVELEELEEALESKDEHTGAIRETSLGGLALVEKLRAHLVEEELL